ncbi:MAG TPA: TPM domain-containing protein, partial [Chthoniobacterales bacterium]|nr:TPM domain-containing protein [Chthoniobacterales bacterium]
RGKFHGDPLAAAAKRFHRLGMNATDDRASVLIWVAPRAHQFAVYGDEAMHKKCGDDLWNSVIEKMREHFRHERFSDALIDGIREVGGALAAHFPKRAPRNDR